MPKRYWWPTSLAEQLFVMQNFLAKIASYEAILPLTKDQVDSVKALCTAFIAAVNVTDQCRQTMQAMTQWRDVLLNGEPEGSPAPVPPVFPVVSVDGATRGIVPQFIDFRDLIVASPGYTANIGNDLGIVGSEIAPKPPAEVAPELKSVSASGFTVSLVGSMQGFDAMRVEYAPKGGSFAPVAFLTNTPGSFQITPANPNSPEVGQIRAIFIKKNVEYGNYSANYAVMLA